MTEPVGDVSVRAPGPRKATSLTAPGEDLVRRSRTRVRFPPAPPGGLRRNGGDSSQNCRSRWVPRREPALLNESRSDTRRSGSRACAGSGIADARDALSSGRCSERVFDAPRASAAAATPRWAAVVALVHPRHGTSSCAKSLLTCDGASPTLSRPTWTPPGPWTRVPREFLSMRTSPCFSNPLRAAVLGVIAAAFVAIGSGCASEPPAARQKMFSSGPTYSTVAELRSQAEVVVVGRVTGVALARGRRRRKWYGPRNPAGLLQLRDRTLSRWWPRTRRHDSGGLAGPGKD